NYDVPYKIPIRTPLKRLVNGVTYHLVNDLVHNHIEQIHNFKHFECAFSMTGQIHYFVFEFYGKLYQIINTCQLNRPELETEMVNVCTRSTDLREPVRLLFHRYTWHVPAFLNLGPDDMNTYGLEIVGSNGQSLQYESSHQFIIQT